ncbi:MAG: hypothetical protein A2758_01455 [Candidatus Zambryskibacteria bacterium RIFCSPHIGHO2_01_FULL_49_18]|uniref:Glycosyltransferase subfamily 4-like N-terminal domain-containing protein n=2 Tax=Candidatus Zambryskiibacteriota TaxID=1817925 RepID=A0A1G2T1F7_9BACT|nr:MAG: hypothetical protein A2758_01455 [Candidatus Zambryskibacteria bacterium RIFCSPHIGHO2_01_FULL_49_18]OHB05164.1 MAG: hypothetical protein A3A26_02590 [Candidatus Zambryskibacteria bacterium RIFCSPLOWO2_01_FULL_47_14]
MRILITTGLSKSDIGGPFQYAHNLAQEFEKAGHEVRVVKYGSIERSILGIWPHIIWADKILALDTFSVGFASTLAAKIIRKKVTIRVGGDFMWSAYVNRTGRPLTLPEFYKELPELNTKEKIIFRLNRWAIQNAHFLAFNTEWQKEIWRDFYKLSESKIGVVRNFIPGSQVGTMSSGQNFLWAGRLIPEKNTEMLKRLGIEIVTGELHEKVLERIKNCYAVVSLAFTDICPNFIIEGISSGKPFIMTKYTGLNELFPKSGIFVEPRNEEEIREAMRNLNKIQIEEIKSHSWGEMAEEYLNIWNKI